MADEKDETPRVSAGSRPGEQRGGRAKGTPNGPKEETAAEAAKRELKAELMTPEREARVRNAELRRKAFAEEGSTPLEVMLDAMRWHRKEAALEIEKGERADKKLIASLLKEASALAAGAAPYVHPRLAAVDLGGNLTLHQLDSLIGQLEAKLHADQRQL